MSSRRIVVFNFNEGLSIRANEIKMRPKPRLATMSK